MSPIVWVTLALAAAAVIWWRKTRPGTLALSDADAATLAQLRSAGADLRKAHATDFFLYLPTEAAARHVAGALRAKGFATDVRHSATGSDWLCEATKQLVLSPTTLARLRAEFDDVVRPHGGVYDGWGAQVVG